MIEPLAILLYERLLPGSQLVTRLQDLHYRVHVLSDSSALVSTCEELTPLVLIVDLAPEPAATLRGISALRDNPATQHLPVIGFYPENSPDLPGVLEPTGLTVFTTDTAVLNHLRQILDQALHLE